MHLLDWFSKRPYIIKLIILACFRVTCFILRLLAIDAIRLQLLLANITDTIVKLDSIEKLA